MWKDIEGYEGLYKVSDSGDVYSCKKSRVIKNFTNPDGYSQIELYKNNKCKKFRVHRLVAKHFLDDYSEDLVVNHLNGIKSDNRYTNLECISQRDNVLHSIATGLQKTGVNNPNAKLTLSQVLDIDKRLTNGERIIDIAKDLQISSYIIYDIKRGRCYKRETGRGY